jgi:hypothetical protein
MLRDFGSYGIIFINVYVVITVVMVMLVRGFGRCGMTFMTALDFPVILYSQFTSIS